MLDTLNVVVWLLKNFLEAWKIKFSLKNSTFWRVWSKYSETSKPKKKYDFPTFMPIFSDLRVVWSWFFYSLKDLGQGNLLNTLNDIVGCVENFLETSEKKFSPRKWGFCQNIPASFWALFSSTKRKFLTFPGI